MHERETYSSSSDPVSVTYDLLQDETLMKYTKQAFEAMLGFKDSLDALCNFALAEASRLDSGQDRFKVRLASTDADARFTHAPSRD